MRQLYSTIFSRRSVGPGRAPTISHHESSSATESCGPVMSMTPFEQAPLAAEGEIDRLGGDPGILGDRGHGGAGIAAVDEESTGGLEDPAPGLLGLIGSQR